MNKAVNWFGFIASLFPVAGSAQQAFPETNLQPIVLITPRLRPPGSRILKELQQNPASMRGFIMMTPTCIRPLKP